jgi:hypothetical protein
MEGTDARVLILDGNPETLARLAKRLKAEGCQVTIGEPASRRDAKNPHAAALGRLGGLVGGVVRAARLSARRRQAIARKAARARWDRSSATRRSRRTP